MSPQRPTQPVRPGEIAGLIALGVICLITGLVIVACIWLFGLPRVAIAIAGCTAGYIVRELLP